MENHSNYTGFMGMSPETFARYSSEYARLNPHNLPEFRRKRRRIVRWELVCNTHK